MADKGSQSQTLAMAGRSQTLTDMPSPWLAALVAAVDDEASTSLMCTCTALRDLVLAKKTVYIQFELPIAPGAAAACQAKLQLACKYSSNIRLWLDSRNSDVNRSELLTDVNASASSLMFGAMAAAGQGLAGIHSVVLEDLILDSVVPSWLISTCPHMTSLHLLLCVFVNLPRFSIPTCGHLKNLSITFDEQTVLSEQLLPRWGQHLCALPAVQSLAVCSADDESVPPAFLEHCGAAIGSQLTQLSFTNAYRSGPLGVPLVQMFSNVTDLSIPYSAVDDGDMEALFSMLSVRRLHTAFRLEHSYTHRPCPWVHLSLSELDVASLARLPLDGMQSFTALLDPEATTYLVSPSSDLEENRRVVAAIRPRMQWDMTDLTVWSNQLRLVLLCVDASGAHANPACIAAVLPLLPISNVTTFAVRAAHQITPELVTALGQYMTSATPSKIAWEYCSFARGACSLLLPRLPSSVQRVVFEYPAADDMGLTEPQLIAMCSAACRSEVEVLVLPDVSRDWQPGWRQRVQAVMVEVAQHHVRLGGW